MSPLEAPAAATAAAGDLDRAATGIAAGTRTARTRTARTSTAGAWAGTAKSAGRTTAAGKADGRLERPGVGRRTTALAAAPRLAPALRTPLRAAAPRLRRHVEERPLVVVVAPLVEANRFFLALAADAGDPARNRPAAEARGLLGRLLRLPRAATLRVLGAAGRTSDLARHAAGADQFEVLTGDRVLVFLAEEVAVHQQVHAVREGLRARLVEPKGPHVLLAAEDELLFLLALGLVAPHRKGRAHQDRHHGHRDQQRRHGVAVRARCAEAAKTRRRACLTP